MQIPFSDGEEEQVPEMQTQQPPVGNARQTFGNALRQTNSHAFGALRQVCKHPLRLSFLTLVFVLASLVPLIGVLLFPMFVMGYVTCIQSTINGERMALERFIGFMRHGWDSLWHLLMMVAAFIVTVAVMVAPFVMVGMLAYFTIGTISATVGEVSSLFSSSDSPRMPTYRSNAYDRYPGSSTSWDEGSTFWSEMLGVGAMVVSIAVTLAILTPIVAAMILFFYLVLEVSRGSPNPTQRFDLVFDAFGKMINIGRSHWKQLMMSGFCLSTICLGIYAVGALLAWLLSAMHLFVLMIWVLSVLVPLAMCFYIVYANVFVTMTCLSLGGNRPTADGAAHDGMG